jgi:multimeric flavodoxin WrbA
MTDTASAVVQVMGVVGSPRRGGNTDLLVDEVLRGAQEAGAAVDKVVLSRLRIGPCRACEGCRRTGECVQKDDMPGVLRQMERSDVWVLGTPVYWWGPTAQFKAFVDRWYAAEGQIRTWAGRRAVLVVPMESSDERTARHTVGMMQDALDYLRLELFATLVAPGVLERGQAGERPELLSAAYQAGQDAVAHSARRLAPRP